MNLLEHAKINYGFVRFLLSHPTELRRVPKWSKERSSPPMELRVPWWPYDAAAWMAERLPPEARVFEFGGGGSTLWLADRGATITVVEHDEAWCGQLSAALGSSVTIVHRGPEASGLISSEVRSGFFDAYVSTIDQEPDDSLDLVIVDGRARVDCVQHAIPKVKAGGLLLLDDTGRPRYRPAIALLSGWERTVFQGLKPGDNFPAQTSVWQRPE